MDLVTPMFVSKPKEKEPKKESSPFEIRLQISGELEERILQLVAILEANTAVLTQLVTQPPYVVVQPSTPRPMKHTPVRGADGKIEYVIVEPYEE